MIFDSPRMERLRSKFKNVPNNHVPQMILLDRLQEYADEKQYLEEVFETVPERAKNNLLGSVVVDNDRQHIGAWFELALYGWLRAAELGEVIYEPDISGQTPDFLIDTGKQKIIVEARAHTKDKLTRKKEQILGDISLALRGIQLPFLIKYEPISLHSSIDQSHLRAEVVNWLGVDPDTPLNYHDGHGNQVNLSVLTQTDSGSLMAISDPEFFAVRAEPVKNRLKSKTGKYKDLAGQGYPYVIALYLEPSHLSAEEVVEAWFGRGGTDLSGIHFYGKRILHKSVSGTLIFKRTGNFQHPFLRGWYVQNPYATNLIDVNLFPVESCFAVLGKDNQVYEMGWK